jgi:hypothetical protein
MFDRVFRSDGTYFYTYRSPEIIVLNLKIKNYEENIYGIQMALVSKRFLNDLDLGLEIFN